MTNKRIKNIEIYLRNHNIGDLKDLYVKLFKEKPDSKWTSQDLILQISKNKTESEIFKSWSKKFSVYNTSITIQVLLDSKRVRQRNKISEVRSYLTDKKWNELLTQRKLPRSLDETRLLEMNEIDNKVYFLVAEKGRSRYVLNGFNYQKIIEPRFTIVVWDDSKGIFEIRGSGDHDRVSKFIGDLLGLRSNYSLNTCYIDDNANLKSFANELSGKVVKVRLKDAPQSDISMAEFTGRPNKNVLNTKEYKDFKQQGFEDNAGGVAFKSGGEEFVIWVGYKARTLWLQKGSLTETILKKVVNAYIKYGSVE